MRLFGAHQGQKAVDISYDGNVDAVASRTESTVYVHIANTSMTNDETLKLDLGGYEIESATMYYIAADPETEISPTSIGCFEEKTAAVENLTVTLPKASVAAIEIKLK